MQEAAFMRKEFDQLLLESKFKAREEALSIVSSELHDNVGQLLNSAKLMIALAEKSPETKADTLQTAHEVVGQAILEIRELAKSLNTDWLVQFDLIDNLQREINRINVVRAGFVRLRLNAIPYLHKEKQLVLYRLIQECLQNTIKHAEATEIVVTLKTQLADINVTISDDGKGIESNAKEGMGFLNMRLRVKSMSGTLSLTPNSPKGAKVTIKIPHDET